MTDTAGAQDASRDELVLEAGAAILRPLLGLMLTQGVKYGPITELLKHLMVEVARERVPGASNARAVSRISMATGIHRKEVKRILEEPVRGAKLVRRSASSEVFTRWLADPRYGDESGQPRPLPRQAADDAPSFESLARDVSTDVHPRSMLEELLRLGLVEVEGEEVRLVSRAFVPAAEDREMLRFLAENAGDHLAAAVANIDGRSDRFLEQAIYADELSEESVRRIEALARERWTRMLREMVPQIRQMVSADRQDGRSPGRRARIGMYSFAALMPASASGDAGAPGSESSPESGAGNDTAGDGAAAPGEKQ